MNQSHISEKFLKLVEIMANLRSEQGCPWDREQTHETLVKYLIEESYEVSESIAENNDDALVEELGDVLLQVVFHAQIAKEENRFDIGDVLTKICDKMIGRHPHVFSDACAESAEDVLRRWESDKQKEKEDRESILDGIPKQLPALMRAQRMQDRAAWVGFDWERFEEVLEKFEEEWREFREACEQRDSKQIQGELGDLFFALVNTARLLKIDAEQCLTQTSDKFQSRFAYIERQLKARGHDIHKSTLAEMDSLWEESKKLDLR